MNKFIFRHALGVLVLSATSVFSANSEKEIENLKSSLESQRQRIEQLEQQQQIKAPQARPLSLIDVGVVADILALSTKSEEDEEGNDKISARHVELVLGGDIDPFSRLDATIAFSDFEDVHLEEAYLTHWGLPWEVKAKLGRLRPFVGKAVSGHLDALDTADEPLVVQEYFGVEGLSLTGLELSHFLPTFIDPLTQELTAGVMEGGNGEGGTLFGETRRRPSYYAHLKNFVDISTASSLELGVTWLMGSSDEDSDNEVTAYGIDATWIHRLDAIRKIKLQAEGYFQDRDAPAIEGDHGHGEEAHAHEEEDHDEDVAEEVEDVEHEEIFNDSAYGYYVLADFRLIERWAFGARYDYVEPVNIEPEFTDDADTGYAAYLTFHQSEFARWRFQYEHIDYADGSDDDRFMLQATVAIGAHKHKLQ